MLLVARSGLIQDYQKWNNIEEMSCLNLLKMLQKLGNMPLYATLKVSWVGVFITFFVRLLSDIA